MNERRKERLASFIEETLPEFFRTECALPEGVFISVVYIEPNEGASKVNVFVSVFPDALRDRVAEILKMSENKAKHFIRARIASKYSPAVSFHVK